jgi:hypothetical protein
VFIDERLDLRSDTFNRSILLHELVHHFQASSGRFETLPSECERRNAEELEAYRIQNKYLAFIGNPKRVMAGGWGVNCPTATPVAVLERPE